MQIENIKHKVNYYSLLLIAFMLPLKKELIAPLIILFIISSSYNFKQKLKSKKTLLLLGLFVLYAIGLLYSQNISEGLRDLETKLSLALFPLVFFFSTIVYKDLLPKILKSFIEGCLASIALGLTSSVIHYSFTNDISEFFYGSFSFFSHASYFSMYLNFGIIVLYFFSFFPKKTTYIKPYVSLGLITVFSLSIFLLSSKTGISSIIVTHIIALAYWIIKHKKFIQGTISLFVIIAIFIIGYNKSDTINNRLHDVVSVFTFSENNVSSTSTEYRIKAWGIAYSLIGNSPIYGFGTGTTRNLLTDEYKKNRYDYLAEKRLNCHNQFIETTLAIGVIGLLILIFVIYLPIIWSVKSNNYLLFFFIILITYNFLTESILETQSGVVFIAFFYTLLVQTLPTVKSTAIND